MNISRITICIFLIAFVSSDTQNFRLDSSIYFTGSGSSQYYGTVVKDGGDINGDGIDDIIFSSPKYNSQKGIVYIAFGPGSKHPSSTTAASQVDGTDVVAFTETNINSYFGQSIDGGYDINKDGYNDILVGAYGTNSNKGAAYLLYGGPSGAWWPSIETNIGGYLDGSNGIEFTSATTRKAGLAVAFTPDMNNDGFVDILITAPSANGNQGELYLIWGGPTLIHPFVLPPNATQGIVFQGYQSNELGRSVTAVGDINGDSIPDILLGAHMFQPPASTSFGAVFLIFGSYSLNTTFDLSLLDDSTGRVIYGPQDASFFGYATSAAGDYNNDGYDDFLVGAPEYDGTKGTAEGAAYLFYGGGSKLVPSESNTSDLNGNNGVTFSGVSSFGYTGYTFSHHDITGDGIPELFISSYKADWYYSNSGGITAIYGNGNLPATVDLEEIGVSTYYGFTMYGYSSDYIGQSFAFSDFDNTGAAQLVLGDPKYSSYRGGITIQPGVDCKPGSYLSTPWQCQLCHPGTISTLNNADSCTKCPSHQIQKSSGQTKCLSCVIGGVQLAGNTNRTECVKEEPVAINDTLAGILIGSAALVGVSSFLLYCRGKMQRSTHRSQY